MACTVVGVRPANGGWIVEQDAEQSGPYFSDDLAMRVAIAQVRNLVRAGKCARLSVQNAGGEPQAEVCRCREFMHTAAMLRGAAKQAADGVRRSAAVALAASRARRP
jgi:hypothetical protein